MIRVLTNSGGQTIQTDRYHSLSGISYSPSIAELGTASDDSSVGHRHSTQIGYDDRGRASRFVDGSGTITLRDLDVRGLVTQVRVGTDDSVSSSNMTLVQTYQYDHGLSGGNGNLTQSVQHIGLGNYDRVTQRHYDHRDRLVATKSNPNMAELDADNFRPITFQTFDNRDRVTSRSTFDGDNIAIVDADGDDAPDAPPASKLRVKTETSYTNRGQVFEQIQYSVDSVTGALAVGSLITRIWYDRRGNVIKTETPGSAIRKHVYDGARRLKTSYTTDGGGDSSWSHADDVSGDIVLDQTERTYDDAGNMIQTRHRERFHDATGTGALRKRTSTVTPSRSYFTDMYYDAANRMTDSVNVGTAGGIEHTRSNAVPASTDEILVMTYTYDAAGRRDTVTHPDGKIDQTLYDMTGRTIRSIDAFVDGTPSDGDDHTVDFTYNAAGATRSIAVQLPGGAVQETAYDFGTSPARGDAVTDNRVMVATRYPDRTTGLASNTPSQPVNINAAGEVVKRTDENGTVHQYHYDTLGRLTADVVSTLGSGIDGSIRRIDRTYNTQGAVDAITSYADQLGTVVENQLVRQYNGLIQMTREYQSHVGAVDQALTLAIDYEYSEMAGGANHSRLESITYPSGRIVDHVYTAGVDDAISRLSAIAEDGTNLESYEFLGLSTQVRRQHEETGVDQTFIKLAGESDGDAGDRYTGLDRFGRVVDQRWVDASDTDVDRFTYGYDRASNRTFRVNELSAVDGEVYQYDEANRLIDFQRGVIGTAGTGITGTVTRSQSWDLDALGNSQSVTTDGVVENRSHNLQNELTDMGSSTLTYDATGNQTDDETGKSTVWDAWNRPVRQLDATTTEQSYRYDGLNRRITEGDTAIYYNQSWQRIEERTATGLIIAQYVWSDAYIDAMILRDRDTSGDGVADQRVYVTHDANFNITGILDVGGNAVQRYQYDPYGLRTILNANFGVLSTPDLYQFDHGYAGGRHDAITVQVHFRNRNYDPVQMRWSSRDPIGFKGSRWSLYAYLSGQPLTKVDPSGLADLVLHHPEGREYCQAIQVRDVNGIFTVVGHGNTESVGQPTSDPEIYVPISPEDLANLIREHPEYEPHQTVRLYCCYVGAGDYPQNLADELGCSVEAYPFKCRIIGGEMMTRPHILDPEDLPPDVTTPDCPWFHYWDGERCRNVFEDLVGFGPAGTHSW